MISNPKPDPLPCTVETVSYLQKLKGYLQGIQSEDSTSLMVIDTIKDMVMTKLQIYSVDPTLWTADIELFDEAIFLVDLLLMISHSESIISMITKAALKRKSKSIPSLGEQSEQEQLHHCSDHLQHWMKGNPDDEATVTDQAKHTACRVLLSYFTHMEAIKVEE